MRKYLPLLFLACAVITALVSFLGDNSYSKLQALRNGLLVQREENQKLESYVNDLKREVQGLNQDPRVLEKAARNELGLARPNETIFLFEESDAAAKVRR